ncbi:Ser-Thr-rich glycosyl-phosphatidyl-inositol-anchored membrane family-domain-containing protein [Aspergillus heterothallicus]
MAHIIASQINVLNTTNQRVLAGPINRSKATSDKPLKQREKVNKFARNCSPSADRDNHLLLPQSFVSCPLPTLVLVTRFRRSTVTPSIKMRSFFRSAVSATLLASLVSAISITEPTANSTHAAGSSLTVNWTTVDTDPSTFSLYLWNFVSWPPSYVPLAIDISTADQSYTVQIPCDTNPEWGYQLSAINGTNVYIIYAQGERFTVSAPEDDCVDAPAPPASSTCDAATTTTVYVTVSPTASSSPSSIPHHGHDHGHGNVPAPPSSTTTAAPSSHYTKPGVVPRTIGWCSDYDHPVTLDHPPTPTDTPVPTAVPVPGDEEGSNGLVTVIVTATVAVPAAPGDDSCPAY